MSRDNIVARGFEPSSTTIVLRTIGACPVMRFHPDNRPIIGIGLFSVRHESTEHLFSFEAKALRDGELPDVLMDWLEARIPDSQAIISASNFGSVFRRLTHLADEQYPRLAAACRNDGGRWRDLPRSMTWYLKQNGANAMPCLCKPGEISNCWPELPACLLPDPAATERQLMQEAAEAWHCWANTFGDLNDHSHPARRAIRDLRVRQQAARRAGEE